MEKIEFLTIKEVANTLKVSEETVRNWINQGMPHISKGRVLRFKMIDIERWLNNDDTK